MARVTKKAIRAKVEEVKNSMKDYEMVDIITKAENLKNEIVEGNKDDYTNIFERMEMALDRINDINSDLTRISKETSKNYQHVEYRKLKEEKETLVRKINSMMNSRQLV